MEIFELIKEKSSKMTKKQRTVALYMSAHPDEMAYITLRDLSRKIGVTEITILNTCQSLGFNGFNELKYEFRKAIVIEEKTDVLKEKATYNGAVPVYELDDKQQLLKAIGETEVQTFAKYWDQVDLKEIFEAAKLFMKYERIFICGRGFSFTVAELLQNYLSFSDVFSVAINTEINDSTYAALSAIHKETLVVAVSFPDYYFMTTKMAEYAHASGAKLLLITDRPDSDAAAYADIMLTVPSTTRVFLNTLSAVMFLLNLLGSALKMIQTEKSSEDNKKHEILQMNEQKVTKD